MAGAGIQPYHHQWPPAPPHQPMPILNDEVKTIFISGLPEDVKEKELQNLLRWFPGYEASQVNFKGEHPMGFALFTTPQFAIGARDALQDMVFDAESNSVLHTEMAKKNLFVKRGVVVDSNAYDQSKRMRNRGDYTHTGYSSPSPFHPPPPPAPVWGPHGYMAPPYGGYPVPPIQMPAPAPVQAPSSYVPVQNTKLPLYVFLNRNHVAKNCVLNSMQPKMKKLRRHIPEEIITLILQRLPVKSLLRFRCVQKSWYHLIQSPLFVTAHSNCQKKYLLFGSIYYDHYGSTRINSSSLSLRFDEVQCREYYRIHQQECYRIHQQEYYRIQQDSEFCSHVEWYAAASHGLICYSNLELEDDVFRQIWLWNPAIRKLKILPDPPQRPGVILWITLAFGFCQKSNDFKVVKILNNHDYIVVEVYSLNTNTWKTINDDNLNWTNMTRMSEDDWVFLNGTAYFRSSTRSEFEPIIASYDTDKDIMREISLPETQDRYFFRRSIGVLHDSLVFFTRKPDESGLNMWVLKGGTNEYYWEKKISVNLDGINCDWTSNGGVLLSKLSGNKLVSYNVEKDERKDFADSWDEWFEPGEPGRRLSLRVDSFSESLVLINS